MWNTFIFWQYDEETCPVCNSKRQKKLEPGFAQDRDKGLKEIKWAEDRERVQKYPDTNPTTLH